MMYVVLFLLRSAYAAIGAAILGGIGWLMLGHFYFWPVFGFLIIFNIITMATNSRPQI